MTIDWYLNFAFVVPSNPAYFSTKYGRVYNCHPAYGRVYYTGPCLRQGSSLFFFPQQVVQRPTGGSATSHLGRWDVAGGNTESDSW